MQDMHSILPELMACVFLDRVYWIEEYMGARRAKR